MNGGQVIAVVMLFLITVIVLYPWTLGVAALLLLAWLGCMVVRA